ncbi:hypothetical protein SIN8267_03518 [Sinobacterium norvegicum]|uniref:Uncharacterized protein n=1 Tax=Sinobacterium norvegicum TaxID=1641715 RepID=A0ABM9AJG3_9GAMM|nr:hypothetical protein SIN8267_03518 [Sinobacterium norvegicum]
MSVVLIAIAVTGLSSVGFSLVREIKSVGEFD